MQRYFFHLISPVGCSPDERGCELPDVEMAYLETYQAALEICFEMLRERRDPSVLRFEVTNESGEVLFDLPFLEALHPTRRAPDMRNLETSLHRQANRHRELASELRLQFEKTRGTISTTQALLASTIPH